MVVFADHVQPDDDRSSHVGYGEIEVEGFTLRSLGSGANSFAFEVKTGAVAGSFLKVYRPGTTTCETERACLVDLAKASISASGFIPKLLQPTTLKTKKNWDALLMTPVANAVNVDGMGSPGVRLSGADFSLLVTVVRGVHNAGWTHRDIKPSCVLFDLTRNHVVLIDFDCAQLLTSWTSSPRGEKL